jgi:hypothetical protein
MDWTPSETLTLARPGCSCCLGLGLRLGARKPGEPCGCVLRAIFRMCHAQFRRCVDSEPVLRSVKFGRFGMDRGQRRGMSYGMPSQEYAADFVLVSKRTLGEETLALKIFKFHFLLGADQAACCRKLGLDEGAYWHEVYRLEARLGRAFRELEPYPLFPTNEYRAHTISRAPGTGLTPPLQRQGARTPAAAERMAAKPSRFSAILPLLRPPLRLTPPLQRLRESAALSRGTNNGEQT